MKKARILIVGFMVLALAAAAGCAKRQLTRSETDRLDAIAAKIAQAEHLGAAECAPKELAVARVALEHARHELTEHFERAEVDVKAAEAAADDLLAKTQACVEAKKKPAGPALPLPLPTPPPPPAMPMVAPPPPPPPMMAEESVFPNIHFDFDKSFIREDAKPILAKVADYLQKNQGAKVLIEGHCDERGTAEYNMALGDRRATSAKKYLVGLGVNADRLSTISYGKERPLCTEHNETCWQKNRRGVFDLK
jgi:peptidoglycan-associated lipoprotein